MARNQVPLINTGIQYLEYGFKTGLDSLLSGNNLPCRKLESIFDCRGYPKISKNGNPLFFPVTDDTQKSPLV